MFFCQCTMKLAEILRDSHLSLKPPQFPPGYQQAGMCPLAAASCLHCNQLSDSSLFLLPQPEVVDLGYR